MEKYDIALIGGDERVAYMRPVLVRAGYRVVSFGTVPVPEAEEDFVAGLCDPEVCRDSAHRQEREGTCNACGCDPEVWGKTVPDGEKTEIFTAGSLEEAVSSAKIIVGGVPLIRKGRIFQGPGMEEIGEEAFFACVRPGQRLFGGVLPDVFRKRCQEHGVECHDFMKDESLAVFNAVATAEGAILEALQHQKTNIYGSRSLVLGFGRCGRVLADRLAGLKAEVTVCCRNPVARTMAETMGFDALPFQNLQEEIGTFEYIYNTVPAVILQGDLLKKISRHALIIDLASAPGGVDYEAAGQYNIQARLCPGLPGKCAPKTSGEALARYVAGNIDNVSGGKE